MNIHMLNLRMELVLLLRNNTNCLLIVTLDRWCTVKRKIDTSEKSHLFLHLRCRKG